MTTPDYAAIEAAARELFDRIHEQMEPLTADDGRWRELYCMFQMANAVTGLARLARDRQPAAAPSPPSREDRLARALAGLLQRPDEDPSEPVDYRPADEAYRKRLPYGLPYCAPFESER